MKPGRVVQIRVNPTDCMAVIDVLNAINGNREGMSFAQVVSTALACAMESLRESGAIPRRDGFEFEEMMQPYPSIHSNRKRVLAITAAMRHPTSNTLTPAVPAIQKQSQRDILEFKELHFRFSQDPRNMSEGDMNRYNELAKRVDPADIS